MSPNALERAASVIPSLRGVFVVGMPDCLLHDAWMRPGEPWAEDEAANQVGGLFQAHQLALRALSAWAPGMQVTVESSNLLLVMRELRAETVVAFAFDRASPLGMARLHVKRLLTTLANGLPEAVTVSSLPDLAD